MNSCALLLVKTTPIRLVTQIQPTVLAAVSSPTALVQDPKPTALVNTTAPTLLAQVKGGPAGQDANSVCSVRPDGTYTYTGFRLDRIDYVGGISVVLSYTAELLTSKVCTDPSVPRVTTVTYTRDSAGRVTDVTTVIT